MLPISARQPFGMLMLVGVCIIGCNQETTDGAASVSGNGGGTTRASAAPMGATSNSDGFGLGGATSALGGFFATGGSRDNAGGNVAAGGTLDVSSPTMGGRADSGAVGLGGASNVTGGKGVGGGGFGGSSSGGASTRVTSSGGKSTVAAGGIGAAGAARGGAATNATGGTKTTSAASGGKGNGGTPSTSSGGGAGGGGASGGSSSSATTPIKVWIAGDSTVQNCSSACPCGWGSQFDVLFNSNVTVVNSAVGGRSVQTWLYEGNVSSSLGSNGECTLTSTTYNTRWSNMTNATSGMKPGDYLLIQFGINDGDSACPRHVGTTLYKSYLATMAKAAKDLGAQPIFLTPTSAIACSGSNATATRGFLTETKAAGTENDVPVIDLHQLSINLYTKLGLCPNSADYTSTTSNVGLFFCEDHTHFEAAGAKQIAQVVAKALKDQGVGLAAYLL